jgi:hypothetical protein
MIALIPDPLVAEKAHQTCAVILGRVDNIWEGCDVWAKAITP